MVSRDTVPGVTRSHVESATRALSLRLCLRSSALKRCALLALCALGLARGSLAKAASAEEVETLIRRGVDLRRQHRDEEALPYFQKADAIGHSPRTAGQLGLGEMAVGYWADAEHHLAEALASDHPWISKNRAVLDRALTEVRANLGDLVIDGQPSGASLFLDGRPIGSLPLSTALRVPKGTLRIEARAPGFISQTREVHIAGADRQTIKFDLARLPGSATGASLITQVPQPETSFGRQKVVSSRDTSSQPLDLRRTAGWTAAIATVAALTFAGVETASWQKKRRDFNNHRGPPADNPTTSDQTMWVHDCNHELADRGGPACRTLYDDSRHARTLAFVGYGAGLALGATSLVLLRGGGDSATTKTALSCAVTTWPGIRCSLTF